MIISFKIARIQIRVRVPRIQQCVHRFLMNFGFQTDDFHEFAAYVCNVALPLKCKVVRMEAWIWANSNGSSVMRQFEDANKPNFRIKKPLAPRWLFKIRAELLSSLALGEICKSESVCNHQPHEVNSSNGFLNCLELG